MYRENKRLLPNEQEELIETLKERFEKNIKFHEGIVWNKVKEKLERMPEKLWSLNEMELTGGDPDIIGYDENEDKYIFCDCSIESPGARRSLCYDKEALDSRKKNKPENNAMDIAEYIGIEMLTEEEYRKLQTLGNFDNKTSSWVKTPDRIRKLGGAIFCDCKYDTVFTYHNGAESYYSSRGFRGLLKV